MLNRKSYSPPSPGTLLRRSATAPYFHPILKICHISPSWGGNQNLLPSPLKNRGDEVQRKSGLVGYCIACRIRGLPVQIPPDARLGLVTQPHCKAYSDLLVKYVRMQ